MHQIVTKSGFVIVPNAEYENSGDRFSFLRGLVGESTKFEITLDSLNELDIKSDSLRFDCVEFSKFLCDQGKITLEVKAW